MSNSGSKILQRYLDAAEPNTPAATLALHYEGQIDVGKLSHACDLLQTRYPVLKARIREEGTRNLLYVPAERTLGGLIVKKLDPDSWKEDSITSWDWSFTIAQLVLFCGDGNGVLALRVNHAIADGAALFAILAETWRLYAAIAKGENLVIENEANLPVSPSTLFAERWPGFDPDPSTERPSPPKREELDKTGNTDISDAILKRIKFTKSETKNIISKTRNNDTKINSLLVSSIMRALTDRGLAHESANIHVRMPVNLRKHVSPSVEALETTNFLGLYSETFEVSRRVDLMDLSRDIDTRLSKAVKNRTVKLVGFPRSNSETLDTQSNWDNLVGVDNMGVLPVFEELGDAALVDFEYVNRSNKVTSSCDGHYRPYTFDGRLNIYVRYPLGRYSSESADELLDRISSYLLA